MPEVSVGVRVIFYYGDTSPVKRALENGGRVEWNTERALQMGEAFFFQALESIFRDQVRYVNLVRAAMAISSPQGIRESRGLTLIVCNEDRSNCRAMAREFVVPEGSAETVSFFEARINEKFQLEFQDLVPNPTPEAMNEVAAIANA